MVRQLYRQLGYSSIHHYAEVELGFSARRTRDFVALSRKLADLPRLKAEVEAGKLGYTAARVIAPIVDRSNEEGWVEFATTHSRRELEREVKTAKRQAVDTARGQAILLPVPRQTPVAVVPVRVSLEMTPTQFVRYESLWEQIRKQGGVPADQVEALLGMMQSVAEVGGGPRGPEKLGAQPAAVRCYWERRNWPRPNAIARLAGRESATPPRSRRPRDAGFWPKPGTNASGQGADTRGTWRSITKSPGQRADPTNRGT